MVVGGHTDGVAVATKAVVLSANNFVFIPFTIKHSCLQTHVVNDVVHNCKNSKAKLALVTFLFMFRPPQSIKSIQEKVCLLSHTLLLF